MIRIPDNSELAVCPRCGMYCAVFFISGYNKGKYQCFSSAISKNRCKFYGTLKEANQMKIKEVFNHE